MVRVQFYLVRGLGNVLLKCRKVEEPTRVTNLISFMDNGRVCRHRSIPTDFGLSLDMRGRLIIHG